MSTPSKRRKKNDYQSSPQAVRSLDFFFGKQKKEGDLKAQEVAISAPTDKEDGAKDATSLGLNGNVVSDEELARKLQAEWNKQDEISENHQGGGHVTKSVDAHIPAEGSPFEAEGSSHGKEEAPSMHDGGALNPTSGGQPDGKTVQPGKSTLSLQSVAVAEDNVTATVPFEESPLTFDPSKYLPGLRKLWAAEGGDASYSLLTRCFILINSTQSRIKIVDTLVNLLRTIIEGDPDSLLPTVQKWSLDIFQRFQLSNE